MVTVAKQNMIAGYLSKDIAAEQFFKQYKKANGKYLTTDKQKQYAANAAALNAARALRDAVKTTRQKTNQPGQGKYTWVQIIDGLKLLQANWGWHLPYSEKNLKALLAKYDGTNYEVLISGKECNDNASKVRESEQQAMLRTLIRHQNNFDAAQIQLMYNELAKQKGWRTITSQTVINKKEEYALTTVGGNRGTSHLDNYIAMQIKRRRPGYPMLYWTMDGWDVELMYQKTELNSQGHSVTTYHHRPTVVLVLDPYTNYPMGYAIGTHETPTLIQAAIRDAINHTNELFGCRHIPRQLQTDRYGNGNKTLTEYYEAASHYYTPAKARNAKAKVIEPIFKAINKNYCQFQFNWSGFGLTAKKENQPNADGKSLLKKNFPDYEGVCSQVVTIIEKLRLSKVELYTAQFAELPAEYKTTVTYENYLLQFGQTTGYTNKLIHNGLNITIDGAKKVYDTYELEMRNYMHEDWIIKYDTTDLKTVLATNKEGTLRYLLEEKYEQPMTLDERTDGDSAELVKVSNYNKKLKQHILQQVGEDALSVNETMQSIEGETLAKLIITDSQGQYKNQVNAQKNKAIANGKKQFAKAQKKEENEAQKSDLEAKKKLLGYHSKCT